MKKLTRNNYAEVFKRWHDGKDRDVIYIYDNYDFDDYLNVIERQGFSYDIIVKTSPWRDTIFRTVEFVENIM